MRKPILCLDFDGVIHSYTSGWKGADVIPDPPVPGAIEFLQKATKVFDVQIFSSRTHQQGGKEAMQDWLFYHVTGCQDSVAGPSWLYEISFPENKPPAMVSLDDRCLLFTGERPDLNELVKFKPWNKKEV